MPGTVSPGQPDRLPHSAYAGLVQVAVCGPSLGDPELTAQARRVGELLAARGATVLCGGGGGVMAAVAAGVREAGGVVIGVLPGPDREGASPDLSAAIVTNMGQARNAILVQSADAVIAIGGSWGTLSEIALAMRRGGVRVVSLAGWRLLDRDGQPVTGVKIADSPENAVTLACGD
jgi:uncharacterized protein (TIGR00725 family)